MNRRMRLTVHAAALLCAGLLLAACRSLRVPPVATPAPVSPLPVRFLLSFDDGPSGASTGNTTEQILDTLGHNRWQPGIKAIFFVQTAFYSPFKKVFTAESAENAERKYIIQKTLIREIHGENVVGASGIFVL